MTYKNTKVIKPISIKAVNAEYLTIKAAEETQRRGEYVSASRVADELLDKARKADEKKQEKDNG